MTKKITFLFTQILVFSALGAAQTANDLAPFQGKTISKILVLGNDRTKDWVILREMKTKAGAKFNSALVLEDQKRIQNLQLFTRVEIYPANDRDEKVGLVIMVAERWFFFPYPLLYRNERSWAWEKWSYGAGFMHNNIRGLNNKLLAEAWFGYNPGGVVSYSNPWFGGARHFYYKASAYSITYKSKTLTTPVRFDESYRGFSLTLGKRWGYHTYGTVLLGYDNIQYPEEYRHLLPSGGDFQHVPTVGLGFLYDTRDLFEYPRSGWLLNFTATRSAYAGQLDYLLYGADVRRYVPLYKNVSLALRVAADLSGGNVPVFAHYFIGYVERIRGQFHQAMEGDSRMLLMAELRFPILPVEYLDVGSASMLGQYSRDLPFGINGGLFYDLGAAWFKNEISTPQDFLTGFGFGLHFRLPYIEVLRLEYGFDPDWNGQFILDTRVAF